MDTYSSLLEAFDALNQRKRSDPASLSETEREDWKKMRREIELALFQHTVDPADDTREFIRVPVSLSARYWTSDELKDRYIPVLGEGGLQISTIDPLPLGTKLDLEIVLAHQRLSFRVSGEVVWVSEGDDPASRGMGVRFVGLTYEQKRMIYDLVDDNLRDRLLERRRFARVDAKLQVQFVYADGFFELETEDVSLGGLFIATDHLLPVGERLRMVLHVPSDRPAIKAVAEVVRVVEEASTGQPAGIGVRFVNLLDADRAAVREYLCSRLTTCDDSVAGDEPVADGGPAERRLHARMEQRIKLRFQSSSAVGVSFTRDISSGGVFIQTHQAPPPLGSPIEVTLVHPVTLQPLTLPGRVVRIVEPRPAEPDSLPGVGVAFEDLTVEQRRVLEDFLAFYVKLDREDKSEAETADIEGD